MQAFEELFEISKKLYKAAAIGDAKSVTQPLSNLEKATKQVERSFSGSWLGYHSRVYYEGLVPAPPGANFSQEWGLMERIANRGSLGWREYDAEEVKAFVFEAAGNPNIALLCNKAAKTAPVFNEAKDEILSILENELLNSVDPFLTKLKADLEQLKTISKRDVLQILRPQGQIMTRDRVANGQGTLVPPHVDVTAEIMAIRFAFELCKITADIGRKAGSHLERKSRQKIAAGRVGTNVFIGHGRSSEWRKLKDFIQDRLQLPWDEFNRVPVAGITNITRLSEMLDAAAIALLVLTAEDEMADGEVQARMNVVHEAGLFQGRLAFTKAILLLEEGCSQFSNVEGLGQIRFPKGNIVACFEEIRRVLEREGLISGAN
jgi:predicted nucleotide-binding protein